MIIPSAILGVLCGGLLARRFSRDVRHNARFLVVSSAFTHLNRASTSSLLSQVWLILASMLGLTALMFVSCQRVLVPGLNSDYDPALAHRYIRLKR